MSARYVAEPLTGWVSNSEYSWQSRPTETVWESDPTPVKTGLLNAEGVPIYRVPERVPLGFRPR